MSMRPFSRSGGEFVNRAQLGQSARCNRLLSPLVMTLRITVDETAEFHILAPSTQADALLERSPTRWALMQPF